MYVNQDGSVRELSPKEQEYLKQEFSPFDGARPHIKASYKSVDGWGSMSGYLPRKKVPSDITVDPVNPQYDSLEAGDPLFFLEIHRAAGDIMTTNPDGSITCTPNPEISNEERVEIMKQLMHKHQEEMEKLGKHPDKKE